MRISSRPDRLERFLAAPRKAVWSMALPMMAGMSVHTIYVIADTAFIGRLGTEALAAATFVGPLFFLMIALTMGWGTAVTALVAQAVGRRDSADCDRTAGTALGSGVLVGLLMGGGGLAFGQQLLAILGASGENLRLAWEYFQVIAALVPLFFLSTVFRSILSGEGDAKTPMVVLAISTVTNIGLDWLFILRWSWGLRGAAVATGLSVVLSLSVFATLLLRRSKAYVRLRWAALIPNREALRRLVGLAVPVAASMLVMSVGGMLYNRLIATFGGVAVAAFGAASKIDMIVGMPLFGLSGAAVAIVGMFAGAGRADLVRSTALYTYRWAIVLAVVIGAAAFLGSDAILGIFTSNVEALEIGRDYLGYMIFVYPMMAIGMTSGRLLQGLGHGMPALVLTTVRVLLVALPIAAAAVLVYGAPLVVIWQAVLIGAFAATVLGIWWIRRLLWLADPTEEVRGDASASSEIGAVEAEVQPAEG